MAKGTRAQERTIADQQIYDNNAKEIDPAMVKLALDSIIDSNFNLLDDELQALKYAGTQTLAQKFASIPSTGGYLKVKTLTRASWATNREYAITHNCGNPPIGVHVQAICTTAEHGYTSGDVCTLAAGTATDSGLSFDISGANSATVYLSSSIRVVQGQANYGRVPITPSRWTLKFNFIHTD